MHGTIDYNICDLIHKDSRKITPQSTISDVHLAICNAAPKVHSLDATFDHCGHSPDEIYDYVMQVYIVKKLFHYFIDFYLSENIENVVHV